MTDNNPSLNKRIKTVFNITLVTVLVMCAVSAVKRIFTGLDIDEEYAVTLAYRIARGDILMKEMWEPHMLSGLILALPVWIFVTVRKNAEFIIVALRIYGVLIQGLVSLVWYRVWRKKTHPLMSLLSAGLIFCVLPKFIQTPEFANVQIWFLLLTGLFILAGEEGKKSIFYILSGVCYIFVVLAYPTCIVLLPLYLVLFKNKKAIIRFVLPVVVSGVGFLLYIVIFAGWKTAVSNIGYIMSDASHAGGIGAKIAGYLGELPVMFLYLLIYAMIALGISALIAAVSKTAFKSKAFLLQTTAVFVAVSFLDQLRFWFVLHTPNVHPQYRFAALFIASVILYYSFEKQKREKYKEAFGVFVIASFFGMIAILILTNLDVKATLVHLLPAGAFWVVLAWNVFEDVLHRGEDRDNLPLTEGGENTGVNPKKGFLAGDGMNIPARAVVTAAVIIVLFVSFAGQTVLIRVNNEGQYEDVFFSSGGKRLSFFGPSRRIYCGYWDGEEKNANYDFIRNAVPEGSRVLYIGANGTTYLMNLYEVCAPSVISTPVYNQTTVEYFRLNPQKMPEYIIIENIYLSDDGHPAVSSFVSAEFTAFLSEILNDTAASANEYVTVIPCR